MKRAYLLLVISLCLIAPAFAQQIASPKVATPTPASAPAEKDANALTPEEWSEVNAARQKAVRDNPEIMAKLAELSEKMRAFQAKLHAAMIKANPAVAPTIKRLDEMATPKKMIPLSAPPQGH